MKVNDCHCHFFSRRFFEVLAQARPSEASADPVAGIADLLDWKAPASNAHLADCWVSELDKNQVGRVALIGSVPGDEESVSQAVARYPNRLVGFFMLDPTQPDSDLRVKRSVGELGLRCVCFFPAMHHFDITDSRVRGILEIISEQDNRAIFVHCGVLSIGVRKKLGLPSAFDMRYSNPLSLQSIALDYPELPIIIPHFGAGFLREALMLADLCPNVYLDTSSSNGWVKYYPQLTLQGVFRQALDVVGCERLLFGSDSSFFPRGWVGEVWDSQSAILDCLGVDELSKDKIFRRNFDRLFPL